MINFYKSYSIAWLLLVSLPVSQVIAGNGPSQEVKLTASNGGSFDAFGDAVSLSNNIEPINPNQEDFGRGSAYIFQGSVGGTWSQKAKLNAPYGVSNNLFWGSVAIYYIISFFKAPFYESDRGGTPIVASPSAGVEALILIAIELAIQLRRMRRHSIAMFLKAKNPLVQGYHGYYSLLMSFDFLPELTGFAKLWLPRPVKELGLEISSLKKWHHCEALKQSYASLKPRKCPSKVIGMILLAVILVEPIACQAVIYNDRKLFASDPAAGDHFGWSVSLYDHRALVGARRDHAPGADSGSAYIFEEQNDGSWTQVAKLVSNDIGSGDLFGNSVSLYKSRALVGARYEDVGFSNSGAAYVFERQNNGDWSQVAKLFSSDRKAANNFGFSLSLYENRTLVGATGNDEVGTDSGAAYVFESQSNGSWIQTAKLVPSDGRTAAQFGWSVSLFRERALVAAAGDDHNGSFGGSAYIFEHQNNGSWAQVTKLVANDGTSNNWFGSSASLYKDTALVGAYLDDAPGTDSGSAYIFERQSNGGWLQTANLIASDGAGSDRFGVSVSLSEERALVRAVRGSSLSGSSGCAYLFERQSNGGWVQAAKLVISNTYYGDDFGKSVSLYETTALLGAYLDDEKGTDSGSMYVFSLPCGNGSIENGESCDDGNIAGNDGCNSTCGIETGWSCTGTPSNCTTTCGDGIIAGVESCDDGNTAVGDGCNRTCGIEFGWNCTGTPSSCYTICGDGIVVGNEACDHGDKSVLPGCSPIGCQTVYQNAKLGTNPGARFGVSVSFDGDNILVGANYDNPKGTLSGSAYVFERFNNGSGWTQAARLIPGDGSPGEYFGESVSLHGSISIVGAYNDDDNGSGSGSAYVFERLGSGSGWVQTSKLLAADGVGGDHFGRSVSVYNSTALIGAQLDDDKGEGSGGAYLFERFSNGTGWAQTAKLLASDGASSDHFGSSVSLYQDMALVGAYYQGGARGSAYVFERLSNGSGWVQTAKLVASDAQGGDRFGRSVSLHEKRAIVGAHYERDNGIDSGSAYVFERQSNGNGWIQAAKLLASDGAGWDYFGSSVSIYGDRALVGSVGDDDLGSYTGSTYVFERQSDGSGWKQVAKLVPSDGAGSVAGCSVSLFGNIALAGAYGSGAVYMYDLPCGNGVIDDGEACDDANSHSYDGCSTTCGIETGWNCTGTPSNCTTTCGDGIIAGVESCDDGNTAVGDGCSSTCGVEIGWFCLGAPSVCEKCGNGIVEGNESCDDSNTATGDGCSTTCGIETGWNCTGIPSNCTTICGDGLTVGAESCDDGNLLPDDGCSSTCGVESGWDCFGAPSECYATLHQNAKLVPNDGVANDHFGRSVSLYGDTALVGAPDDDDKGSASGSAYVFNRLGNGGGWKQTAKLVATDGAAGDLFGEAVSLYGDTALVGARLDDDKAGSSGSAYVFEHLSNGSDWVQTAKLVASDGSYGDEFGVSVSLYGDTALIGVYGDQEKGPASGSAHVFERLANESGWTRVAVLVPSDGAIADWIGYSVSLYEDIALLGSYRDDDMGSSSGSAYIFERLNDGSWTQAAKLVASDAVGSDEFGYSVSVYYTTALIGARYDDDKGSNSGSVYVFDRLNNGSWIQTAKLVASDGVAGDVFGASVSLYNRTALVGAHQDDDSGSNSGSAYVFDRISDGSWKQVAKLVASDGVASDIFGRSVSLYQERALVGAMDDDDRGSASGSAYLYFFLCGNGIIDDGETCDDGDTAMNDGCSSTCAIESGWNCTGTPSNCTTTCGDGIIAGVESCDDGTTAAGDGCSSTCSVETGWNCSGTPSNCSVICGDGLLIGDESCDDGNAALNDGCNNICDVEAGWICTGTPSNCITTCGDGLAAGLESCDDGNSAPNDGCSSTCMIESGWNCTGAPSECATTCGDGVAAGSETCDDGNTSNGDGCNSTCSVEFGWVCPLGLVANYYTGISLSNPFQTGTLAATRIEPNIDNSWPSWAAANGIQTYFRVEWHGCLAFPFVGSFTFFGSHDDGAYLEINGDMVYYDASLQGKMLYNSQGTLSINSRSCAPFRSQVYNWEGAAVYTLFWKTPGSNSIEVIPSQYFSGPCYVPCGDELFGPGEECDDGNAHNNDGCNSTCAIETGWSCTGTPSNCTAICGDNLILGAESCDDGNTAMNDGCSSSCSVETGWNCSGIPSVCEKCGNGVREGSEECDDSNTVSGDGCSSSCQLEGTVISVETEEDTSKSWSLGTAAYASVTNYDGEMWEVLMDSPIGSGAWTFSSCGRVKTCVLTYTPPPSVHGANMSAMSYVLRHQVTQRNTSTGSVMVSVAAVDAPPAGATSSASPVEVTVSECFDDTVKPGSVCPTGYAGQCCFQCDEDYYRTQDGECVQCGAVDDPFTYARVFPVIVAGLVLVGIILFGSVIFTDGQFDLLMLSIVTCQYVAEVGNLSSRSMPVFVRVFYQYISVITLDVSFVHVECQVSSFNFYWLYGGVLLALPLASTISWCLCIVTGAIRSLFLLKRRAKVQMVLFYMRRYIRTTVWLFLFLYYLMVYRSFQVFSCVNEGGIPQVLETTPTEKYYLNADPVVECYVPAYYVVSAVAATILFVTTILYPAVAAYFLIFCRPFFEMSLVRGMVGQSFEGYKTKFRFLFLLAQVPVITLAMSAGLLWFSQAIQIVINVPLTIVILLLSLALPMRKWWENILHVLVLITMLASLTLVLFYSVPMLRHSLPDILLFGFAVIVVVLSVACLLFLIVIVAVLIVMGIRSQAHYGKIVRARSKPLAYGEQLDVQSAAESSDDESHPQNEVASSSLLPSVEVEPEELYTRTAIPVPTPLGDPRLASRSAMESRLPSSDKVSSPISSRAAQPNLPLPLPLAALPNTVPETSTQAVPPNRMVGSILSMPMPPPPTSTAMGLGRPGILPSLAEQLPVPPMRQPLQLRSVSSQLLPQHPLQLRQDQNGAADLQQREVAASDAHSSLNSSPSQPLSLRRQQPQLIQRPPIERLVLRPPAQAAVHKEALE